MGAIAAFDAALGLRRVGQDGFRRHRALILDGLVLAIEHTAAIGIESAWAAVVLKIGTDRQENVVRIFRFGEAQNTRLEASSMANNNVQLGPRPRTNHADCRQIGRGNRWRCGVDDDGDAGAGRANDAPVRHRPARDNDLTSDTVTARQMQVLASLVGSTPQAQRGF